MPTYEYECRTCGHIFDAFQSMSDEPLKVCPECGREIRRRIYGGTGVIFKGSGFYITDKPQGSGQAATRGTPMHDTFHESNDGGAAGKSGEGKPGADGAAKPSGEAGSAKSGAKEPASGGAAPHEAGAAKS